MNADSARDLKEALETVEELREQNERLTIERNEQAAKISDLNEQLEYLLRQLYGRKSERFENPDQLDILKDMGIVEPESPKAPEPEKEELTYKRRRATRGPKPLPDTLPRDVHILEPEGEERICNVCNEEMEVTGEIVTEELTVVPPQFRVTQYVQRKCRCRKCMNRDIAIALPPRPIEKGRPSPSLLAFIIVSKYVDHQPLYRQEQIFKRYGLHLPRSTMNEWLGQLTGLLSPIVQAMKRKLLQKRYLQLDETPIRAQDRAVKGKTRTCYLWAYTRPGEEIVYDFTPSRAARGPRDFLGSYSGVLQTDGYSGFKGLYQTGRIEQIACMAHIRRKFEEAKEATPERIGEILALIQDLYSVEREARASELRPEERATLRCERSTSVFDELKTKIDGLRPFATPKNKIGRAVRYAEGQWKAMRRYLEAGEAEIDNNWVENAIRPVALGRKNFLFLGSVKGGGERAEIFYSLLQSCQRLGVDPFEYLEDVLLRVSYYPHARVSELTPRAWKQAAEEAEKALA